MSNINIALVLSELILAGKHPQTHIAVFCTLMDKLNEDRDRVVSIMDTMQNEFSLELIYF